MFGPPPDSPSARMRALHDSAPDRVEAAAAVDHFRSNVQAGIDSWDQAQDDPSGAPVVELPASTVAAVDVAIRNAFAGYYIR